MKKSAAVRLTVLAGVVLGAQAGQHLDPCAAATFNEQACQSAIQNRGYCWNGRWVRMKYRQPFPYYYDTYQQFVAGGGVAYAGSFETCDVPAVYGGGWSWFGVHGHHGGFGATGSGHGHGGHG